jgi:hypothetical protein
MPERIRHPYGKRELPEAGYKRLGLRNHPLACCRLAGCDFENAFTWPVMITPEKEIG